MVDSNSVRVGTVYNDDDELRLAAFGKKQKMKRHFNIWSLLFMSFCTSVTWEALTSTMAQALTAGGSSSMVWGFLASAIGTLFIALSISEFASMIPTSGGQYDYVTELSPLRVKRVFSWIAGWLTIWGWILSGMAGIFANAMQIQAYIILFKDGYIYERWHTSLITIGLATTFMLVGIFCIRWIPKIQYFGIILHVVGYLATIIYLLVKVHPKNSASYVFTDVTNLTGWKSNGVSWSIGLLSSALGLVNWDSSSHMAEEMHNASRHLPRTSETNFPLWQAIVVLTYTRVWICFDNRHINVSMGTNCSIVIALMFCITDIEGLLSGPVGTISPLVQLMYNVSGGELSATFGMTIFFLLLSSLVAGPSVLTAASRIVWSFAREGGLPKFLARIDERQEVPVNALLFTWLWICALACVYIGNSTAFYGLSSGCTTVLIFSYLFPIAIHTACGLPSEMAYGPFTLGKWSRIVNIVALAWGIYLIIFMCFPAVMPVSATNMNYSSLVLGFGFIFAAFAWFAYGNRSYRAAADEINAEVTHAAAELLREQAEHYHHHDLKHNKIG